MKYINIATLFACVLALSPSIVFAASTNAQVASGKEKLVWRFAIYRRSDCAIGPRPKATFRQPKNGSFRVSYTKVAVPKGKKCAGKLLNYANVYYRSKRGYRGNDKGRAYFRYRLYAGEDVWQSSSVRINLSVR